MTDVPGLMIDVASAAHVQALEIWSKDAVDRLSALLGFALPPPGRAAAAGGLRAIKVEPLVWLLDGPELDVAAIEEELGDDGVLTAIGGGLVRVRMTGPGWRALLMADGVFDAENPTLAAGHAAATLINHVAVRLHVIAAEVCELFVPASFATGLIQGWFEGARVAAVAA